MPDYLFYQTVYMGTIQDEAEFNRCVARARVQLAPYRRIYTVTAPNEDAEKMAICAMADAVAWYEGARDGTGGPVASVSVGSVSETYSGGAAGSLDFSRAAQNREMYRRACLYLDIYRGVGGC